MRYILLIVCLAISLLASGQSNVTGGKKGAYTLSVHASNDSPTNGATLYFSAVDRVPVTATTYRKIIIPKNGTITACTFLMNTDQGTIGSGENISVYVRLNNATDYLVETVGVIDGLRIFDNYNMSIPVVAGNYVTIKVVYPTWATPCTGVNWSGNIFIQQ